jgi:hypothetical protein
VVRGSSGTAPAKTWTSCSSLKLIGMAGSASEAFHRTARTLATLGVVSFAYSWLPGIGLNLMPRKATPSGFGLAASMVIAMQMMLIEVAAIASSLEQSYPSPEVHQSDRQERRA